MRARAEAEAALQTRKNALDEREVAVAAREARAREAVLEQREAAVVCHTGLSNPGRADLELRTNRPHDRSATHMFEPCLEQAAREDAVARGLQSPMGASPGSRSPLSPTAEIAAQVAAARREGAMVAEAQAQARAVATVGAAMVDAGWEGSAIPDVVAAGGAQPQPQMMVAAMMSEAGWTEGQGATPRGMTAAVRAPPTHAVDEQI